MTCPRCGAKNPGRAQFCARCGAGLLPKNGDPGLKDLLEKGEVSLLLTRARAWAEAEPKLGEAQRWLGHATFFGGRHPEALKHYQAASEADAKDMESALQAGALCLALGKAVDAETYLERALGAEAPVADSPLASLYGKSPQAWMAAAWLNLGLARRENGRIKEGVECLSRATELDAASPLAWSVLGDLHLRLGDFSSAIASYEQALTHVEEGPSALALHNDLGVACFRSGRYEQALEHFKRVIHRDPRNANAIHNLGLLYLRQGDPAALAEDLQSVLKADDAAGVLLGLTRSLVDAARQEARSHDPAGLVGVSQAMRQVFDLIQRAAVSDATVLILGENGTGKEMVARAVHQSSARRDKPFIAVHCAALPEALLESELFGYEKGAFTGAYRAKLGRFELAEGGTLFLDEIGDLDPGLQVKLLRVIQERTYERLGGTKTLKADVRIIAATHDDLRRKVGDGRFREDLYYRLYVIPILLPPLRQRREDIGELARFFLMRTSRRAGKRFTTLHPAALERLMDHDWPGNVRELENVVERAVALYDDTVLLPEYLGLEIGAKLLSAPAPVEGLTPVPLQQEAVSTEKDLIIKALKQNHYHIMKAAQSLGISRRTLYRKLEKHGIPGARDVSGS